jgi:hypothetical protein
VVTVGDYLFRNSKNGSIKEYQRRGNKGDMKKSHQDWSWCEMI